MGALSEDEDEGEKSPDAKIPRVNSPKAIPSETSPKVVVPKGKGGVQVEASKDVVLSEDDRSTKTVHAAASARDTLAATSSEKRPPKHSFDERSEFL